MARSSNSSSAPKNITWWIALILVVLGILGQFFVPLLSAYAFWFVLASAVLLLLATRIRNL